MKRLWIPGIVFLIAGCQPTEPTAKAERTALPTVTITTARVTLRDVPRTLMLVGTLAGSEELTLSPKVDGRVLRIRADIGDLVYPGEVLLELDPVDLKLEVDAAKRGFEAELARLGLTALPTGEFLVEEVPTVQRAEVILESGRREMARIKMLAGNGSLSRREIDAAEQEFNGAVAAKRDAVTQAKALLASARLRNSNLEAAEQRLRDAVVIAPPVPVAEAWGAVSGAAFTPIRYAVSARMVSEGEMLRSNPVTNAFKLVLDYTLKLRAQVPEQYTPDVRIGQPVQVKVEAYPTVNFPGRISRINPTIDPQTRTFSVEISIPNSAGKLKAGGFARAFLTTRIDDGVRTVPPQAIVSFAGISKVFIIENNVAKAVEISLGTRDQDWVEVLGPLPPTAVVAISGFSQLVEGSPVTVR